MKYRRNQAVARRVSDDFKYGLYSDVDIELALVRFPPTPAPFRTLKSDQHCPPFLVPERIGTGMLRDWGSSIIKRDLRYHVRSGFQTVVDFSSFLPV